MLPASDITEILTNLSALNLQPATAAAVIGAVLAPLLRNSAPDLPAPEEPPKARKRRAGWPRGRPRRISRRRKKTRARHRTTRPTEARERARAAIMANPDKTVVEVAKLAKVGYGTVCAVRKEIAAEARKAARKPRETPKPATPKDRRQRAQQFLRDELARGPKSATAVEEAAAKVHIDDQALTAARADLGIVTSRANTGGAQAVQWSLPG